MQWHQNGIHCIPQGSTLRPLQSEGTFVPLPQVQPHLCRGNIAGANRHYPWRWNSSRKRVRIWQALLLLNLPPSKAWSTLYSIPSSPGSTHPTPLNTLSASFPNLVWPYLHRWASSVHFCKDLVNCCMTATNLVVLAESTFCHHNVPIGLCYNSSNTTSSSTGVPKKEHAASYGGGGVTQGQAGNKNIFYLCLISDARFGSLQIYATYFGSIHLGKGAGGLQKRG